MDVPGNLDIKVVTGRAVLVTGSVALVTKGSTGVTTFTWVLGDGDDNGDGDGGSVVVVVVVVAVVVVVLVVVLEVVLGGPLITIGIILDGDLTMSTSSQCVRL